MSKNYVHELFLEENTENIIEVFDCYDTRYGNIFFKGQLVAIFYKESYFDALQSYSIINKMKKSGLDIENAKVLVYSLEPLRDYQDEMEEHDDDEDNLNFELAIDYSYEEMFHKVNKNIDKLKEIIDKEQKINKYFKFIKLSDLKL